MLQRLGMMVLLLWAGAVAAHPVPFSYLDVEIDDLGARGALVIHIFDAAHELGLAEPEVLLDQSAALSYRAPLLKLITPRLHIAIDGQRVEPTWGGLQVLEQRQSLRLPFDLGTRTPGQLNIEAKLFPYDPSHQSFVNIYEDEQLKYQALLDIEHATLNYYSGTLQGRFAVVRSFIAAGIHHIAIGPDHILFLVGLLLPGGSLRKLITIITAFTIGHSITLSLAVLGIVNPSPRLIEPAIALSIIVVGVDNLLLRSAGPTAETSTSTQRDLRPWFAAVFGLVHGFGFASVLLELGLPRSALGWSLASFNIGVEIGQLLIVLVLATALARLRRTNIALADRCVLFGSIAVVAAGTFWFVQRIAFTSV